MEVHQMNTACLSNRTTKQIRVLNYPSGQTTFIIIANGMSCLLWPVLKRHRKHRATKGHQGPPRSRNGLLGTALLSSLFCAKLTPWDSSSTIHGNPWKMDGLWLLIDGKLWVYYSIFHGYIQCYSYMKSWWNWILVNKKMDWMAHLTYHLTKV